MLRPAEVLEESGNVVPTVITIPESSHANIYTFSFYTQTDTVTSMNNIDSKD